MTLQSVINSDLSQYLGEYMRGVLDRLDPAGEIQEWSSRWEKQLPQVGNLSLRDAPPYKPPFYEDPMDGLRALLQGVHHANRKLQEMAQNYLEETLKTRSDHPPHTALYIAFTRLLALLREKANSITARHLHFYYHNVLGLEERDSLPDVVHLSFEIAPQLREYILPAGTRLAAGKDPGGSPREYATDTELFINHARIDSLKALYLVRDRFHTSPHNPERVLNVLALPQSNSEDGQ